MEHWFDTPRGPVFARTHGDPSLPRLLLLHGFPEFSGAWDDLAPLLAGRFHCIAPDQRGYGRTGGPDDVSAYRLGALVADMVAVIGESPVTVMGHDWGASVAYGLAISAPHLVERLIVLNGVHPIPFQRALAAGGAQSAASQYINALRRPESERGLAANGFERLMAAFSAKMDMSWMTPELLARYKAAWRDEAGLKTMIHWYRASPLVVADPGVPLADPPVFDPSRMRVSQPHLLIWGEGDTALLPEATAGLEDLAPDLTRVTLPDADHWIAHQRPEEVARAVLDWMDAPT